MAIDIRIPKEIRRYEAKFVGPLTMRQTICVGIGLPVCIGLYNILKYAVPRDLMLIVLLLPAAVTFLFGWVKPYGMKFEQFFFTAFINNVLAPKKRKYVIVNHHEAALKAIRNAEEKQEEKTKTDKKQKTNKHKYVRSKLAIK